MPYLDSKSDVDIKHILKKAGWSSNYSLGERRICLLSAIIDYGLNSTYFALEWVKTMHKNKNPTTSAICEQDMIWIKGKESKSKLNKYQNILRNKVSSKEKVNDLRKELNGDNNIKTITSVNNITNGIDPRLINVILSSAKLGNLKDKLSLEKLKQETCSHFNIPFPKNKLLLKRLKKEGIVLK